MGRLLFVIFLLSASVSYAANTMTVRPVVYKNLLRVEKHLGEGHLAVAIEQCSQLLANKSLNPYERSIILQMQASALLRMENYQQAIKTYQTVLSLEALPRSSLLNIRHTLAQLYMQSEQYDLALQELKKWLDKTIEPSAEAWFLLASIYVAKEQYHHAISPAEKALRQASPKNESYYQLLLGLYQRSGKIANAVRLLDEMLQVYPQNKEYWLQQFYMLHELGKLEHALAVLDMAFVNQLLDSGDEWLRLVQLHIYQNNPYRAAIILQQGMDQGIISVTDTNLKLLASAWFSAREHQKTLVVLQKAARLSGDGKSYYRLAQAYSDLDQWQAVVESLLLALKDPEYEDAGAGQLLLGIAYTELEEFDKAQRAFQRSKLDNKTHHEAEKWLSYLAKLEKVEG